MDSAERRWLFGGLVQAIAVCFAATWFGLVPAAAADAGKLVYLGIGGATPT
jgi:hypothetical protein